MTPYISNLQAAPLPLSQLPVTGSIYLRKQKRGSALVLTTSGPSSPAH